MEKFIIYALTLIFPFFFLNITVEKLITNKLYLIFLFGLILLLVSTIKIAFSKKISWKKNPLDLPVILFVFGIVASIIISSSNKVSAILNPYFGLVSILSLSIFYFFLSREADVDKKIIYRIISALGVIISIISIVIFLNLFKSLNLALGFPVGSNIDLIFFLGFSLLIQFFMFFTNKQTKKYLLALPFVITFGGLIVSIYGLIKSNPVFPPFNISWLATIEILKSIKTALFGFGVGSFTTVFTQVKNIGFNQTNLWQINGFNLSRSAILHITTEAGLLTLLAFISIALVFLKTAFKQANKLFISLFAYLFICLFLFPTSLVVFFLFFLTISLVDFDKKTTTTDLSDLPIVYLGVIIISLLVIGGSGYFLVRTYFAEIYFNKSVVAFSKNDGAKAYESLRQAIILNPNDERFLTNYSQINYAIANNIAAKQKDKLTKDDEQSISQAIQVSIGYGKAVLKLNPRRADYWENLGSIYRNIIPVVKGSDAWAIASYQRAIILDPQNPRLRLNLGSIYYILGKYEDATSFFMQATSLKPDWANAQYNLAWGYYQKKDYQRAALTMQNVLNLLDKNANKTDYEKVQKELEQFKLKLPQEVTNATGSSELSLPEKPSDILDPKIALPKEASPEAK